MGVNQYYKPVQRPDYYKPIADELYLQGAQQTYNSAYNVGQNLAATESKLFGISTYGKDAEVLAQAEEAFNSQVADIVKNGVTDPQSLSKINSLINQFSSNNDILAIHRRKAQYDTELANKKEAELKGRNYVSPLLRQANEYYNSGVYKTDKQFNGQGFVAPEDKELIEALKSVPELETWIKNGSYDEHYKSKAIGALSNKAYQLFTSNPQWQALHNDNFEQQMQGIDINDVVNQGILAIEQIFPHLPPEQQQQALAHMQEGLRLQQENPYLPSMLTSKLRNDYIMNQAYMAAEASAYSNLVDKKPNEFTKIAIQHQNAKELLTLREQEKNKYKQAAAKSTDPLKRQMIMQAINLGYTDELVDETQPDGLIPMEELVKLGIAKPESKKEEEKIKYTIGDKQYTKSDIDANISSGNIDFIKGAIKSYIGDDVKDIKIDGDDIKYEYKGFGKLGWDKEIKKSDLLKLISNISYVTPDGKEVDVTGYSEQDINKAVSDGIIKVK